MATQNLLLAINLRFRRIWLVLGWMLVLLIVYLSLTPAPIELPIEQGDKFSHLLAYFAVMSWFANLYKTAIQRVNLVVAFTAMGIALEFAQALVAYRSFEVADMVAGATGVALGWLLAPPRTPNYLQFIEKICKK